MKHGKYSILLPLPIIEYFPSSVNRKYLNFSKRGEFILLFDVVKSLCISREITITELERKIKFGNGTIRKWNTSSPGADKLEAVAQYFDVSVDYLLGRKQPSAKSQAIAAQVDRLPPEKQDLVNRYVEVIQKE